MAFITWSVIGLVWYLASAPPGVPLKIGETDVSARKIDKAITLPEGQSVHEVAVVPTITSNDVLPHNAKFIRVPNANDMTLDYPRVAFRDGIKGSVTLNCAANEVGALVDCGVIAENPRGRGFGLAALRLSKKYQLAARSQAEPPQEGARFNIALEFSFED